jgi:hypothetical protein
MRALSLALVLAGSAFAQERLGGPEASEPVASVGMSVPYQAVTKTLLAQALRPLSDSFSITGTGTANKFVCTAASGNCLTLQTAGTCIDGTGANDAMCWDGTNVVLGAGNGTYIGSLGFNPGLTAGVFGLAYSGTSIYYSVFASPSQHVFREGPGGTSAIYAYIDSTGIKNNVLAGTAGSGTGITVNTTGHVGGYVHKITVAETALTAAATTQDITLWTLPAKTRLVRIVVSDVTGFTGGGLTAMTVACGPTAGTTTYLPAGSIFTTGAVLGDAAAEIGTALTPATWADIPSMTATSTVSCRFTSTTANVVAATAGTASFYIEAVTYP